MRRVVLIGDPTRALGAIAEPECRRVLAAIELARRMSRAGRVVRGVRRARRSRWTPAPRTWTGSPGCCAAIIEFTQDGGEINVVVTGINVGAQPYWNAEATMLMHTKGILVMTPDSAMVLTGKQSLDYSGGVSAEDNFGIGGYDRIMGPNGQAQYWAPDLSGAVDVLLAHYAHTYRAPGERFPRPRPDVRPGRPGRPRLPARRRASSRASGRSSTPRRTPSARSRSTSARCCARWPTPTTRPWSAGWTCWTRRTSWSTTRTWAGTRWRCWASSRGRCRGAGRRRWTVRRRSPPARCSRKSSKKTARAINAASGNRPLVVLANLSGFDGSPESLRQLQLEYGAEIGRAVVNFDGPIVFCVISPLPRRGVRGVLRDAERRRWRSPRSRARTRR